MLPCVPVTDGKKLVISFPDEAPEENWVGPTPDAPGLPAQQPPTPDSSEPSDGRDTIGGHLRRNWPILAGLTTVAVATFVAYADLKSDIRANHQDVSGQIQRLQDRIDHHLQWHRDGMGGDPEPAETRPPNDQDELRHGLLRRGESEPRQFITEEQFARLVERQRSGDMTPQETDAYEAVLRYWAHRNMSIVARLRPQIVDACVERAGIPWNLCRRMFREDIDLDVASEICEYEMRASPGRCATAIHEALVAIAPHASELVEIEDCGEGECSLPGEALDDAIRLTRPPLAPVEASSRTERIETRRERLERVLESAQVAQD